MVFNILYGLRRWERRLILSVHKQMDGLEAAIATLSSRLAALDKKLVEYLEATD